MAQKTNTTFIVLMNPPCGQGLGGCVPRLHAASAEVARRPGAGIIWRLILSPVQQLMLTVSWDLSWQPVRTLACGSSCALGFLTMWWLGSHGKHPKRKRFPGESILPFMTWPWKPCSITSATSHLSRQSQGPPHVQRERM